MVFRGSTNIFAKARPIIITEIGRSNLHGYDDRDLFIFFVERGYACYRLDAHENLCGPLAELPDMSQGTLNLLMVPQERTAEIGDIASRGESHV